MKLPGKLCVKLPGRSFLGAATLLVFTQQGFLRAQTAPPSPFRGYAISGVVVNASTGQPLGRADVTLQTPGSGTLAAETTTDVNGRFAFEHLPAAKYALRASRRGFMAAGYDEHEGFSTAIVTGEGLVSDGLIFRLPPQAVIGGTVTDDSGDPVPQARVSLYRQQTRNGLGKIVRSGMTITDDLGLYEFARLEPGDYYIAVNGTPWYAATPQPKRDAQGNVIAGAPHSPLDVAYPMTFYDGVTDSDSATPISLKAGDTAQANLVLHAVPAVHFSVEVPALHQGEGFAMPELQQEAFGASVVEQPGMASWSPGRPVRDSTDKDGTMVVELGGFAPGHYEIDLRGPGAAPSRLASVDATSDIKIDASQAAPLPDVLGKIALADGDRLPDGVTVSLRPQDPQEELNMSGTSVGADGTFTLRGIAPGNYEVLVNTPGTALAITQMIASGATVDGHMLNVGSQPVTLAGLLAEGSATVNGFVKRDGKPAAGVMVLLAPQIPAANREMFRRDQSDSDGSFTLNQVIPGEYTVVAIEDGWTLDWAEPEVIAHYLAKGRKVTVSPRSKNIALEGAIEVQPK